MISLPTDPDNPNEIIEEFDKNDLLMDEERNKTKIKIELLLYPGETPTPIAISEIIEDESEITNEDQKFEFNK